MAPLRVLCIHGYRQNGSSFREKTGALRKLLKKQLELVYITAPLTVLPAAAEGRSLLDETLQQLSVSSLQLNQNHFTPYLLNKGRDFITMLYFVQISKTVKIDT